MPALVDLVLTAVDNAWATRALSGIEAEATDAGIGVVMTIARDTDEWMTRLMRRRSEGAVIVGLGPTGVQLGALAAAGIPVVLVDPVIKPPDDVSSVGSTNWEGGRSAGEHLVGLGHRRIGIVDAGPGTLYNAARVDGFRSALTNAGLDLPTSRIVHGDWSRDAAGEAVLPVLAGADRPTALFACSESMAFGIYDAAASLGLRIPQDLSVVGFDDLPEAQWATPPMTTVQQPTAEMGSVALRILLDLIRDRRAPRGRPRGVTRIELATHFVVRGSTAPPEA
ncbi:substrate-binding domain-containing protein [Frondihabitans sp. PAMC 28766]|uniref:substrate-binding domain-containing protein n=1 Tax=Frondihabitans sp. PAMC 28766 TaxID=1795630 RepID=UPI001EF4B292|nr:substrate-binding domain-containing protein [Frondihabitans sp. PAMC 28766]